MALAAILDKPALQSLRTAVATIRAIGLVAVTSSTSTRISPAKSWIWRPFSLSSR